MNPRIRYEHVFTNYIEHKTGTNEYVYEFPEHWLSFQGKKEIGLRDITVKPAARDLRMSNMYFKNSKCLVNIGFSVSLGQNEDMTVLNEKLKKDIKTKYIEYKDEIDNLRLSTPNTTIEFGINDYIIQYEHANNEFWIKVLKNDPNNVSYLHFEIADKYMSDDLKAVLGIDDIVFNKIARLQSVGNQNIDRTEFNTFMKEYPNVIVDFISNDVNETKIKGIGIKKVWNREQLFIASTLSTLAEDKFLTLSNIEHNPLKCYEIRGYNTTFSIFLYDSTHKNMVEIPNDQRDLLLVEMLISAI